MIQIDAFSYVVFRNNVLNKTENHFTFTNHYQFVQR
jgi:hypothetical protein